MFTNFANNYLQPNTVLREAAGAVEGGKCPVEIGESPGCLFVPEMAFDFDRDYRILIYS
jgi:hypothetical protein